jgi:hypothetical protein
MILLLSPHTPVYSPTLLLPMNQSSYNQHHNQRRERVLKAEGSADRNCRFCKVNYFNENNLIVRHAQHIALKSCSDPTLSPFEIVNMIYPM